MKFISNSDWKEVLNNNGALGNFITSDDKIEIVHLTLKKDAEIPLHSLPIDVTFFVLEGKPTFVTDSDRNDFNPNDTIICKANQQRSWINKNVREAKILVIKTKE